jgi:hypothetical protein
MGHADSLLATHLLARALRAGHGFLPRRTAPAYDVEPTGDSTRSVPQPAEAERQRPSLDHVGVAWRGALGSAGRRSFSEPT